MARERYLRGVDPEELKQTSAPSAPQTPRSRWENFWFHYKGLVIGVGIALAILAILLYYTFSRVKPDYMICMVTSQEVSIDTDARLEELLTPYAVDRNGDGKVSVQVQCLNVSAGTEDVVNPMATANQQTVMGHIAAGDVDLWAVSPEFYNTTLTYAAENGDPSSWFLTLSDINAAGIAENGKYWDWTGIALLEDKELWSMEKTLYWGVFDLKSPTAKQQESTAEVLAFLKAFAEAQVYNAPASEAY